MGCQDAALDWTWCFNPACTNLEGTSELALHMLA